MTAPLDLDEDDDDGPEILYRAGSPIATIVLNRPDFFNAWTPGMERDLRTALETARTDPDVRAVIVTGAGRGFCVGADLKRGGAPSTPPPDGEGDFDQRYTYMLDFPKLLVAAINGPAAGVGFCLTLFCDLRFMAEGAKLTTAFSRRGLVAEHGAAWMLPRLIGPMNALDLLMSGRTIDTQEAVGMGLVRSLPQAGFKDAVERVVLPLVADVSPRSLRIIRRQVYESLNQRLGEAVVRSNSEQRLSFESADFQEARAAIREGRGPRFSGQ